MEILSKMLEREVFEKGSLLEGQTGFRKNRATMDNFFVLDHAVQSKKIKKKKTYAFIIDLKADFDTVSRQKLWKILEQSRVSSKILKGSKIYVKKRSAE